MNELSSEWVIYALYFLSSLAVALILERFFLLFLWKRPAADLETLLNHARNHRTRPTPLKLADARRYPARALLEDLLSGKDADVCLQKYSKMLNRGISVLGTIATIAPMLGLLGTVTGMIKSFAAFDRATVDTIQLLSGIDEALYTTSLGLMIAIPGLVAYNALVSRTHTYLDEMELVVRAFRS